MAKPVLGKNLKGKRVVSVDGMDLGYLADAYFETTGEIVSLVVRPEHETKQVREHVDKNGYLNIPYVDVKAIGRYVVVNFPFTK